jgi:LAS superfamily LD-carboxypeptidase LdcB
MKIARCSALLAVVVLVLVGCGRGRTSGLDLELAARVSAALVEASELGVPLEVTSGWRSADHQQQLFDDAVARYGSRVAASAWVLPPEQSEHVRGRAVDVGPAEGRQWLAEHGSRFGLCLRYANEPWHFEPLTAPGEPCPPLQEHAGVGAGG